MQTLNKQKQKNQLLTLNFKTMKKVKLLFLTLLTGTLFHLVVVMIMKELIINLQYLENGFFQKSTKAPLIIGENVQ